MQTEVASWRERYPAAQYVTPFAIFVALLAAATALPLESDWAAPLRNLLLGAVCLVCWPQELPTRPRSPLASVAVGAFVFVLWIAPDLLIPGYRHSILFSNNLVGHTHSSLQAAALRSPWILFWRSVRAILIVPVIEELFWRGWLMRWLIDMNFRRVPLGSYTPLSFWLTAVLFASEHGPYWDVGLVTGIIYNAWMIRTKSVADCILMHAVTNGLLSAYVLIAGQWQYWQ